MKKNLMILSCLLFFGCSQSEPNNHAQKPPKENSYFLAGLELDDLPALEQIQTVTVTPIKPTKKVKNTAEVITTGPAKVLTLSEKKFFKEAFCRKENFNFKIKKKCIFIAEFMISFDKHKDFVLFISLSTNQMQILNRNDYQIIDFSTAFESSENLQHLRALLSSEKNA